MFLVMWLTDDGEYFLSHTYFPNKEQAEDYLRGTAEGRHPVVVEVVSGTLHTVGMGTYEERHPLLYEHYLKRRESLGWAP
jgi:hypothetical protein